MSTAPEPVSPTTCTSDDCSDTHPVFRRIKSSDSFVWSDEDAYFTKLFKAWDNLPLHDASTETPLLRELDHMISLFESYIGHNDLGFRAWTRRHQRAMELGVADVPTWPKLYTQKGGKRKWRDDVWVSRYSFLVHQRDIIAKSRLQKMTSCKLDDKKCFFGLSWAFPRQTVRTVQQKQPARLQNRWYEPLDYCLARMAYESYGRLDFYSLHSEFWGTATPTVSVIASNCKVKCEPEDQQMNMDCIKEES